jgi:hypothetical protein
MVCQRHCVLEVIDNAGDRAGEPAANLPLRLLGCSQQLKHSLQRRFGLIQQAANQARS